MKRLHAINRVESSHSKWEGLAAAVGIIPVSLLLFYFGIPLWAVVVIQLIGFYLLKIVIQVTFTRAGKST